ncbi:MAG: hypothetical protein KAJ37_12730 [Candidatus Krumholzibacteria bacterium]|nr:hypothetical protein [Candidatus Krumholzibacteria bacterium]
MRPKPKEADVMFFGIWNTARANKENIFYSILTIFLLERVRRGWNRIEARGRENNLSALEITRKQQTFTFNAALLYALPFLLPTVKYIFRSMDELSQYVSGLAALNNVWVFVGLLVLTEALLSIVIYNLLGIYVERMNGALGFFKKIGRSVVDGSRVAVQTVGIEAPARFARLYSGIRRTAHGAAATTVQRGRSAARSVRGALRRIGGGVGSKAARSINARTTAVRSVLRRRNAVQEIRHS